MSRPAAALLLGLVLGAGGEVLGQRPEIPLDPRFERWVRANTVSFPSVDAPWEAEAWRFLRSLIGKARVVAIGENIHGGHEPLALRNHIIRYAVTQLGFTAVAIESGFSDGQLVDRYVQGEALGIDSVLRVGINNGFGLMPENRELVTWLRDWNRTARRRVRFYGIDQTGAGAREYSGTIATNAVLRWLGDSAAAPHRAALGPLAGRFEAGRFQALSPDERSRLRQVLLALGDSVAARRRVVSLGGETAARNVWAALRLFESFAVSGREGPRSLQAVRLRDSVMAENTRWVLRQQGPGGRMIVFAHNGHVWDVPMAFPAMGPAMEMMGARLRRALGGSLRVFGMSAVRYEGMGEVLGDISAMETAFARVVPGNGAVDLRTGDADPVVRGLLREPWITRIHAWLQPITPRRAMDVLLVLEQVTRSKMESP